MKLDNGKRYQEISCTDDDCDWERYPNTGHGCEAEGCEAEATVAVVRGVQVWMACVFDKVKF